MAGQRVDVLTRDGAVPGVVAREAAEAEAGRGPQAGRAGRPLPRRRREGRRRAAPPDPSRRQRRVARRAARAAGQPRRLPRLRQQDGLLRRARVRPPDRRGRRRARRRDRRGRRAGGGRRLRRLAHGRVRHRARPRRRDRRDAHHRRARRRSRGRGQVLLGGGPTLTRGPSIHEDVFELLYETAEAEGIPLAVEVSPRLDVDRRRRHLPQPPRTFRQASS